MPESVRIIRETAFADCVKLKSLKLPANLEKLDCNDVRLTTDAEEKLILGSKLMEVFNNHKHFTSDGQSSKPIQQIRPDDFSKKIKIG